MLRNLSEEGIGLWIPSPPPTALVPGAHLKGDIMIGHEIHPVELECMHLSDRLVGLKIVHRSELLAQIFRRMLEPSQKAEQLVANPSSGGEDPQTGVARLWFQSGTETELLVWYENEQRLIVGLQLSWSGSFVARERFHEPRTGYLGKTKQRLCGLNLSPAQLLIAHEPADPILLSQAAQFLMSVPPPLPGTLLWQFLETGEQVYLPETILTPLSKAG